MAVDLTRLHRDHHAKYLVASEDAQDPEALFETFVKAWPAVVEGPDLTVLSTTAQDALRLQAEAAEAEAAHLKNHFEKMASYKNRIKAAHESVRLAARGAYAAGATAQSIADAAGVSLATVNQWVRGARQR